MITVDLRPIVRTMLDTYIGTPSRATRRECWRAETTDGEWAFERDDDGATLWHVVYKPGTALQETCGDLFTSLARARRAVERGQVKPPSVHAAEHAAGEHSHRPLGCISCTHEVDGHLTPNSQCPLCQPDPTSKETS